MGTRACTEETTVSLRVVNSLAEVDRAAWDAVIAELDAVIQALQSKRQAGSPSGSEGAQPASEDVESPTTEPPAETS